jgi:hypothetical protein
MKAPTNLSHKPIISVNDYEKLDAEIANKTDVKALSIGIAQYNKNEISLKVWRHTGKMWSRQNEELPIHRNIDLTILLLGSLLTDVTSKYPVTSLREEVIDENKVIDIKNYYQKNKKFIESRLKELKTVLDNFLTSGI